MTENEKVYHEAVKRIEDLVQEIFERCDEVADECHYERDWVLERFKEEFNRAKRRHT